MLHFIFKKYPPGFEGLFFTQAFFNFSFYGLKSIFILYAMSQLPTSETEAISLFATLMALCYGTSILGGWVADHGLGIKNTILLGGILQAAGIFAFMFSSPEIYLPALALISLGSGFYKPTLSTSVGLLFADPKDPQKDKTYSTFYMAMNMGSFVAPLLCGFVSKAYGGYYNSLMLIVVTLLGGAYLFYQNVEFKQQKKSPPLSSQSILFSNPRLIGILMFTILFFLYLLLKYHNYFSHLMGIIALGSILYLGKAYYQSSSQERRAIAAIVVYILLFTFFCALFEQVGSSLLLFFNKAVNRNIMGMELPSSALLSLGPIFVLTCTPFLILFSEKILEKTRNLDGLAKMGIGFTLVALSFFLLALGCSQGSSLVPVLWVIGAILIQTIGELFIVPIGFSNISKLAPPRFQSLMMSFWLMAIAYGHYFAGVIAQFSLSNTSASDGSLEHYQIFFLNLALLPSLVAGLLFLYYYGKQAGWISKKHT